MALSIPMAWLRGRLFGMCSSLKFELFLLKVFCGDHLGRDMP